MLHILNDPVIITLHVFHQFVFSAVQDQRLWVYLLHKKLCVPCNMAEVGVFGMNSWSSSSVLLWSVVMFLYERDDSSFAKRDSVRDAFCASV